MQFFVDRDSTVEVPLEDGVTVWLRKYIDAGARRDLQAAMDRWVGRDGGKTQAQLHIGDLLLLQKMIVKVITPERTYSGPIGRVLLRKLDRSKLIAVLS